MKNIKFLLILIGGIFLATCGKEEERICIKSDFVGDFVGTTSCSGAGGTGAEVATIIRVSDGSAANEVTIDIDGLKIDVVIDGCTFTGTDVNADVNLTMSGSLDGENIQVKLEGTAFSQSLNCESKGEKN